MLNRNSYLCISGWGDGVAGIEVGALVAGAGVDSIDNAEGVCTESLSNYATLNMGTGDQVAEFTATVEVNPLESQLDGMYTVALLGIRITPLDTDVVLRGSLTYGSQTWWSAATVYGQTMERTLPDSGVEGHSLMGSGLTNLVFHDLPEMLFTGLPLEFALTLDAGFSLSGCSIRIGSIFAGLQIPFANSPGVFTWSDEVVKQEFTTRALAHISSDGVMRPSVAFEVTTTDLKGITGVGLDYYNQPGGSLPVPNFFRAMIASVGQPMLLSPYPYAVSDAWGDSVDTAEIAQRIRSIRQNFFSIYGLLDRRSEITVREFNEGLNTEYRVRMRFAGIR